MVERKVLIIEPDTSRVPSWHSVLSRLSYQPVIVADIAAIDWPNPDQIDWLAVLFGAENPALAVAQIARHLQSLGVALPLVSTMGEAANGPHSDAADSLTLPRLQLELPIRAPQITSVLKRCEQLRSAVARALKFLPVGRSRGPKVPRLCWA